MLKYILASGSPRRKEILTQVGISFAVMVSECDEMSDETSPDKLVISLASRKSNAVAHKLINDRADRDSICVIGADTMVFLDSSPMGKPSDEIEAFTMLKSLQGTAHSVLTGVSLNYLTCSQGKLVIQEQLSFAEETRVHVTAMTDDEIREYISTGEPMDKAGAYGIQGYFSKYIEGIEGDYFNVVGFPICRFCRVVKNLR